VGARKAWATLFGLAALLALQFLTVLPQARPADSGFSFVVYGDSRTMFYLPYKSEEAPAARHLLAEMFELVLPKKEAEAVAEKHVTLIYDPSHELAQIVMPFDTMTEVTTLTVDKGWVTKGSVEDVKLLPGVHRIMFELQGGDWVAREAAQNVKSGRAQFILHTGDLVWWGATGQSPLRKRVLEAGERRRDKPIARAGSSNARCRSGRSLFSSRRQS
jgi:hypothetical protein